MGILRDKYANDPFAQAEAQAEADSYKSFSEMRLENDPWHQAKLEEERWLWMTTGERKVYGDPFSSAIESNPEEPNRNLHSTKWPTPKG